MQQFALLCVLAAMLPAQLVLAQHRGNFGGDNFRGGNFRGGPGGQVGGGPGGQFGGGTPNTFITIASAAPAAAATDSSPAAPAASAPAPASGGSSSSSSSSGGVSASLIPSFGITAGVSLNDGTPRCAGVDGKAIDCDCPPTLATFLAGVETDVASGADFPTGNSAADQLARLNTAIITLQNIKGGPGSGVGCPLVATTWAALRAQLEAEA